MDAAPEDSGLKRVLGPATLVALGVGATIGAGLFSLTGIAAGDNAGPAVTLSYIIAAIACGFAGLCYSELAGMIPVAGSAYSYAYVTMGELIDPARAFCQAASNGQHAPALSPRAITAPSRISVSTRSRGTSTQRLELPSFTSSLRLCPWKAIELIDQG